MKKMHGNMKKVSRSAQETKSLAAEIFNLFRQHRFFCLYGDLGSGKTTFIKGMAEALGIKDIKSPTYAFVREHETKQAKLVHIDLYRLQSEREAESIAIEDYGYDENTIFFIEWADRLQKKLPRKRVDIRFEYVDEKSRKITIHEHKN